MKKLFEKSIHIEELSVVHITEIKMIHIDDLIDLTTHI